MASESRLVLLALLALGCGTAPPPTTPGGDGGALDGGIDPERCPGLQLTDDGALDLTLRVARVQGVVTLGGAPFGEARAGRGALVFAGPDGEARVPLPARGEARFDAALPPATYDVRFEPAAGCDHVEGEPPIPCAGTIAERITVTTDGVLDLDVRTVRVRGELRADGAPLPEDERGLLSFVAGTASAGAPLARSGPAAFDVHLVPGRYDVLHTSPRCEAAGIFCGSARVREALDLRAEGVLDLDLSTVRVRGSISLDGAAFPEAPRGTITLSSTQRGATAVVALPFAGPATFDVRLAPGRYDVRWSPSGECAPSASPVPCLGALLRAGVELRDDGALDLDLRAIRASGVVTLNGGPLPDSDGFRGVVAWIAEDGSTHARRLGARGPASYEVVLSPGRYDVAYLPPEGACAADMELPCGGGVLHRGVELDSDGSLDLDLTPVRVGVVVTLDGAPLPEGALGQLALRSDDSLAVAHVSLGRGDARVLRVLPGTYDAVFSPSEEGCRAGLPCNEGPLRRDIHLTSDGALDLDVRPVRVIGEVSLAGAALPEGGRGAIRFGGPVVGAAIVPLGATGPARFEVSLLPERYVIWHAPGAACDAANGLPCAPQALAGCGN